MAVLMNIKEQLSPEQQASPLFFALSKLEGRMLRDLRTVPEGRLREGIGKIAAGLMWAVSEQPELKVVEGGK